MAAELSIRARAPPRVVAALVLATCLVLAATVANASRPVKVPSSSEGDAARTVVVESPAGYIQTVVVVGTAERGGAGHRLLNVDMLGGIKDTAGPSPGAGH